MSVMIEFNKAERNVNGNFQNTIPAVVRLAPGYGPCNCIVLRPDQDWMVPQLKERGIAYILAQEIWPQVTQTRVERERGQKLGSEKRNADRVDGFDRDDLGESPDY